MRLDLDQKKALAAMKRFRRAVLRAVAVLGRGPATAEVLLALVREGTTQEAPVPAPPPGALPTPGDAEMVALARRLAARGQSWRMIRATLVGRFAGTGATAAHVSRRLQIYRDLMRVRPAPATPGLHRARKNHHPRRAHRRAA